MSLPDLAAENEWVKKILEDKYGHQEAAEVLWSKGVQTSEAAVRRYRKANGIVLSSSLPETMTQPVDIHFDNEDGPSQNEIELRKALNATLRKLGDAKAKKDELVDAVYTAAYDASMALSLAPVPEPTVSSGPGSPEVAVAVLGDWQLAKVTPTYNSEVCEDRIETYGDKVLRLTNIQRADHPVDELYVFLLGDMVEGELIFPGQHWLIDSSLYMQVCVDGPRILGNFLIKMLANFKKVHVVAVIGNHGRLGGKSAKDHNPETNADRMLYKITQQILHSEERLSWDIPDGDKRDDKWYAIARIGNYSSLLFHGNQIGFNKLAIERKVGGWASGAISEKFNDVDLGHYHCPTMFTVNHVKVRINGSPESDNNYAIEVLGAIGQPSQGLRFVDPRKGRVTITCEVDLN